MFEVLNDRLVIEISGEAPLDFLQKLTTNDLTKNRYCYSYMLTNQGRYLFDFFVYNFSTDKILIDIHKDSAAEFISKLTFYKLRTNVTITVNNNYSIIYTKKTLPDNIICSYLDPRFDLLGFRSIIEGRTLLDEHNVPGLYLSDKYKYAIPDGYIDLIFNKSIPIEYGAEELCSISYNKGCYVGQEVISRAKYQGVIRKKIFKIKAINNFDLKDPRAEIKSGEMILGTCCSYYKDSAIALIREENIQNIYDDSITIENIPVKLEIPEWRRI